MSVPPSVQYFASKLTDYELTPITLDPVNGREYTENQVIEFELPSSSLVDLDSLRITFGASCSGTDVSRLPEDVHKLIRRVEVTCGSELLGHAYEENGRLKGLLDAVTGRIPHPTSHPEILRQGLNRANPGTIVSDKPEDATQTGGTRFTWDKFGGFIETAQPRTMDMAILPAIIVRIHTAGSEAITKSDKDDTPANFLTGGGAPDGYTITDPRMTFDTVSMGAAYDGYVNAVLTKRRIQIPFTTYRHYRHGNFKTNVDVATSTRSLDRVIWAVSNQDDRKIAAGVVQDVDYVYPIAINVDDTTPPATASLDTASHVFHFGEKYHASRFLSSYDGSAFTAAPDITKKFTLNFNGIVQPNREYDACEWFTNTTNALSEFRNPWNAGLTFAQWLKQSALCAYRLNRVGSTVQTASGVDTRNSAMQLQIQCPGGLTDNREVDVWLESTALLNVTVGRDFSVEL